MKNIHFSLAITLAIVFQYTHTQNTSHRSYEFELLVTIAIVYSVVSHWTALVCHNDYPEWIHSISIFHIDVLFATLFGTDIIVVMIKSRSQLHTLLCGITVSWSGVGIVITWNWDSNINRVYCSYEQKISAHNIAKSLNISSWLWYKELSNHPVATNVLLSLQTHVFKWERKPWSLRANKYGTFYGYLLQI